MSDHTQTRLTFRDDGEANVYHLMTDDGRWLLSLRHNGEQLVERQRENMRRIAACWNACKGVPTEVLEAQQSGGLPWSVADQIDAAADRNRLRAQRDELLELLRDWLNDYGDCAEGGEADELMQFTRTAIAKATGQEGGAA